MLGKQLGLQCMGRVGAVTYVLCLPGVLYICICHGYFVKYDNYIYSPANIYNVHAISQYMKLTLWHHTINTALALDKFLIKAPPLMHIKARLGGWGARRRR